MAIKPATNAPMPNHKEKPGVNLSSYKNRCNDKPDYPDVGHKVKLCYRNEKQASIAGASDTAVNERGKTILWQQLPSYSDRLRKHAIAIE
jgi:hypothetical protein